MLQRRLFRSSLVTPAAWGAVRSISLTKDQRDDITRSFNKIKEEAKGQSLDLADMSEAARSSQKSLVELQNRQRELNEKAVQAKLKTLSLSLKAYNTRLNNLHNEARALHSDCEKLLKIVWGQDAPPAEEAKVESEKVEAEPVSSDFDAEIPPAAQRLETMKPGEKPTETVETVEGEVVTDDASSKNASGDATETEIEIESVEVDPADADAKLAAEVEEMSVTDITRELHDQGIDFSDCLDAKSLRKRFVEFKTGKVGPAAQVKEQPQRETPSKATSRPQQQQQHYQQRQQQPPQQQTQQQQPSGSWHQDPGYQQYQQNQTPNTTDNGVIPDPNPGSTRRAIDPMKCVWEVKADLAKEHNVTPERLDLVSNGIILQDHKRIYEYPFVQHHQIEIRMK